MLTICSFPLHLRNNRCCCPASLRRTPLCTCPHNVRLMSAPNAARLPPSTQKVLALGEPAHTIFAAAAAANDFLTVYAPKDFGVNVTIVDQTRRNQTLSEVDMKLCVDGLSSPPPAVVLVGMAYLMQLQFAAAFLDHGAVGATPNAVIGFDDGFDRFDPSSLQGLFVSGAPAIGSVGPAITDFFVTASTIAVAARAYASKQKIRLNVLTTGSPTIASWADAAANSTQISLTRAALFGADTRPAILYAGGYGTGANESLRLFAKAVLATNTSYQYAFSPHPGIPSSRALEIFEECGVLDLVLIVDKSICAGTGLAAVACNATVSEGSTVAVQSVFVGVPSFYIANSTADAANVLVDSGQIPVDTAVAAAISTLRSFEAEGWHFDRSRLDNAGIPTNATAIMCKRVADLLKQRGVSDPSV